VADWVTLGDRAIRFARPIGVPASAIVGAVKAWPGVVDVVVAQREVAAYFDREPVIETSWIAALASATGSLAAPREIEIPAIYDGADLDEVSRAIGTPAAELHASAIYTVDTMGFAPGFAYMTGLDERLALPRRATPRPSVPAGAIAIAGGFTAVYPFASPGGWHLLGRTTVAMFGLEGPRLQLGDRVRFVPC
jgi:KipI family sensor histidine kinase inhibitor